MKEVFPNVLARFPLFQDLYVLVLFLNHLLSCLVDKQSLPRTVSGRRGLAERPSQSAGEIQRSYKANEANQFSNKDRRKVLEEV